MNEGGSSQEKKKDTGVKCPTQASYDSNRVI